MNGDDCGLGGSTVEGWAGPSASSAAISSWNGLVDVTGSTKGLLGDKGDTTEPAAVADELAGITTWKCTKKNHILADVYDQVSSMY